MLGLKVSFGRRGRCVASMLFRVFSIGEPSQCLCHHWPRAPRRTVLFFMMFGETVSQYDAHAERVLRMLGTKFLSSVYNPISISPDSVPHAPTNFLANGLEPDSTPLSVRSRLGGVIGSGLTKCDAAAQPRGIWSTES